SLVVLVGGTAAAVRRVGPVLTALSRTVHHVGDSGAGALLKLAVNNVLFSLTAAVAEALVLAERYGIAPEAAYDAFCDSAIGAPAVRYRREAMLHPDTAAPSFRLDLAAKDLRLAADHAVRVGVATPQAAAAASLVQTAVAQGLGDADLAALPVVLRGLRPPGSAGRRPFVVAGATGEDLVHVALRPPLDRSHELLE
ncbi:MAG: NAD(P)-dependent oxidoreductase, partial [Actinobacteria bacterium]|nr:NAD(P)-dependent oxidoreductase [Actinomycetota bacterium]